MSIKINALLPAAAAAAGVTTSAGAALADALLAVNPVSALHCAEINDGSGKVMVFAVVNDGEGPATRPVAGSDGNIKLYSNASSALKLAKSTNLLPGAVITFSPYAKPVSVGDPLEGLKNRYKIACGKGFAALSKSDSLQNKISNAVQFGWDVSTGATLAEYQDLLARRGVLDEWQGQSIALVESLADRLTTASIDPTTVATAPQLPA